MSGNLKIKRLEHSTYKTIQDFSEERNVYGSLMDWKLSIWSSKDQKDCARKAMISIPITRDTCVLEDSENSLTITNESSTWKLIFQSSDREFMVCIQQI